MFLDTKRYEIPLDQRFCAKIKKKHISTSTWCGQHQHTGLNTQHLGYFAWFLEAFSGFWTLSWTLSGVFAPWNSPKNVPLLDLIDWQTDRQKNGKMNKQAKRSKTDKGHVERQSRDMNKQTKMQTERLKTKQ